MNLSKINCSPAFNFWGSTEASPALGVNLHVGHVSLRQGSAGGECHKHCQGKKAHECLHGRCKDSYFGSSNPFGVSRLTGAWRARPMLKDAGR